MTPVWIIPNELACPEFIEKCGSQGVDYNSVSVKDLRTCGPFAIYGGKTYRGLKAEWILAPSQLGVPEISGVVGSSRKMPMIQGIITKRIGFTMTVM